MTKLSARIALMAFLFTAALLCRGVRAEEDGIDIFLKAIDPQGPAVIKTAAVAYEMTKELGSKTEEEIQAECDLMIANYQDMNNKPLDEAAIRQVTDAVRAKYSQGQTISGLVRFDYSQDPYRYTEIQFTVGGHTTTVIQKQEKSGPKGKTEAAQLESPSTVFISNTPTAAAKCEEFGRFRGLMAGLFTAEIPDQKDLSPRDRIIEVTKALCGGSDEARVFEIVETKPYDNGSTAYTLECGVGEKVTRRCTIVPEMGYICTKAATFNFRTGDPIEEYEADDFVKQPHSDLWYPTHYTERQYNPQTGALTQQCRYTIDQDSLVLNEPMTPEDFALEISANCGVIDAREGKNTNYVAVEPGELTLEPGGFDLEKLSWLKKPGEISSTPPSNTAQSNTSPSDSPSPAGEPKPLVRILLIAGGLLIIAAALVVRWLRNK